MELLKEKKILFIYFLYLFIGFTIYLTLHVSEFPYKYVFTDWLINYEGGFIRRGLLGQICFYISNVFNLDFKYVVLIFQILIRAKLIGKLDSILAFKKCESINLIPLTNFM